MEDPRIPAKRTLQIAVALIACLGTNVSRAGVNNATIPVIHVTDLFRPHMDPDDHWDLACVYALACRGDVELKGVLIDYPPPHGQDRNPDIAAVAQMNRITGLSVPVAVGSPHPMKSRHDAQPHATPSDHQGVRMVLDTLRASDRPVFINVTGCSRDIAIAGKKAPDLFADKCAGIYLNAGTGSPDRKPARLEYNVTLDRAAYAAIFDLPCPVYWMPCFEGTESQGGPVVREYASHYTFRQDEILPHLSEPIRSYFVCMFARHTDHNWLGYLTQQPDSALLADVGAKDRHMWCTAGFFHASGHLVTSEGRTLPRDKANDRAVFAFDPVDITCSEDGLTRWHHDADSENRFIFHVRDMENYQRAMTKAMKSLLVDLP
jgi:hypothetical protein